MAKMSYSPPEPMVICGEDTVNVVQQQDITTSWILQDPEVKLLMKLLKQKVVSRPAPARGTHQSPRMLPRNCLHVRRFLRGVHVFGE